MDRTRAVGIALVIGEVLTPIQLVGGAMVIIGVVIAQTYSTRP